MHIYLGLTYYIQNKNVAKLLLLIKQLMQYLDSPKKQYMPNIVELKSKTQQPQLQENQSQIKSEYPFIENINNFIANSVVINKKLHKEIVEKEYLMKAENQDISQKMNTLLRQMQELHKKTQKYYEETVHQNQKTRFLAQELIRPYQQELSNKMDQTTTLTLKLKLVLNQFDSLGEKFSYQNEQQSVKNQSSSTAIQFIKSDILPIIGSLEHRLNTLESNQMKQTKKMEQIQLDHSNITHKINEQISIIKTNLFSFHKKQESLAKQLSWASQKFNQSTSKINEHFNSKIDNLKKEMHQFKIKIERMNLSKVNNDKNARGISQNQLAYTREMIEESILQVRQQIELFKKETNKHTQQLLNAQMMKQEQNEYKLNEVISQNKKIKDGMADFLLKIQEEALNNISKAIIAKVHKLELDSKNYNALFKSNQKRMNSIQRELTNIKNILAQKANFSDFIRFIQMKADKEDYKELKDLVQIPSTCFPELKQPDMQRSNNAVQQNTSLTGIKLKKKKSSSTQRKIFPGSRSPIIRSNEKDDSLKKYMLGFDNPALNKGNNDKARLFFITQGGQKKRWSLEKKQPELLQ